MGKQVKDLPVGAYVPNVGIVLAQKSGQTMFYNGGPKDSGCWSIVNSFAYTSWVEPKKVLEILEAGRG